MQTEKLESALRNAHAAGDIEAAKKLANALKASKSTITSPAVEQPLPIEEQESAPVPMWGAAQAISDRSGIPMSESLRQAVNPNRGFKEGATRAWAGLRQLGSQVGEGSGLLPRGRTRDITNTELARQEEANKTLEGIPVQKAAMLAGEYGPYATTPGVSGLGKGMLSGLLLGGAQFADSSEQKLKNTALGGTLGGILGKVSTPGTIEAIKEGSINALKKAKSLGYKVPPSQANPTKINEILEGGIAGEAKTAVKLAKSNQGITDGLAKKSIGLRESDPLSYEMLDEVRRNAGKVYSKLSKYTDNINVDKAYSADLKMIVQPHLKGAESFGGAGNKQVIELIKKYDKSSFTPEAAVKEIKKLRANSKTRVRSIDNPDVQTLGRAEREVADTIESMVERDLSLRGNDKLIKEFKEARKTIAKTHTIEEALNPGTGSVDAHKIASMARKPKARRVPLDGELKDIADFSNQFRSASQMLRRSGTDYSVFDTGASLVASAATKNPLLAAMPLLRPAVRGMLTSKPYQSIMTNPAGHPALQGLLSKTPNLVVPATGLLNQ